MHQLFRFSISSVLGFIITASLFIGMLSLLNNAKSISTKPETNISFSFMKAVKVPDVTPPKTPVKPELQEASQAPAAPTMTIPSNDRTSINLPVSSINGKSLNILQDLSLPGLGNDFGIAAEKSGGIKSAIPPMYPPKQMMAKQTGQVKVLINVNEMGRVSTVEVLSAKPARVFNAATIKSVKKWQFHQKIVDGIAVPYQVTQTVEFKLNQ